MKNSLKLLTIGMFIFVLYYFSSIPCFAVDSQIWTSKSTSNPEKIWTIKFNKPLNNSTINNNNIAVIDSSKNLISTDVILGQDNKSIIVSVSGDGYPIDKKLYLYISKRIQSENGVFLKKSIIMPFTVTKNINNSVDTSKNNNYIIYTVSSKDTLWKISKKFNTTIEEIKYLNHLNNDLIKVGQELKIPSSKSNNNTSANESNRNETIITGKDNNESSFKLGNERLTTEFSYLIDGKKIGLVTNQTGVNSKGVRTIDVLANYNKTKLTALYGPEHGIDGKAKAGAYVKSYTHETLNIPVYSLYGDTRKPTDDMLKNIDVLIFDIQDIGARSYTYMSTLNYCMKAAAENNKEIIVLDRPNPLGGLIMDGPIMEDKYITFVGVDNLPMTHGMTAGELANFFNRKIHANLTIIPMTGYTRDMVYQDTGLNWVQSSPYIPDIDSVFCYNATGLGDGTGIFQMDSFKWVGGKNVDSDMFALFLNSSNLPGIKFIPDPRGSYGGVKLKITDYHKFNPARTGIYILSFGRQLKKDFKVPKSGDKIIMFDKIMGTALIGESLEKYYIPEQIEAKYKPSLDKFKEERKQYLIYN